MPDSEKLIEKRLVASIDSAGGWALKLPCTYVAGLPDRMCLLPKGIIFFIEVKTTGKKPTKLQLFIHERLRRLGFAVYVADSFNELQNILDLYDI
jgi:hypothetical protein